MNFRLCPASSLAAIACCALLAGCSGKSETPPQPPPPVVGVVKVEQRDVPVYGEWVASLDGYVNANIQPQVSGYLLRQNYREGSFVSKGEVLFEIDPRPFQAALDQARGQVSQARGQLAQAEAQLQLATINVNRDTPLAQARAVPKSQLDNDIQAREQAKALVETDRASIESAEAAVENAQLNLGFTHVCSLIDGIAGIATTQIGNLVGQTTVLTAVSQVNPIKVYFPISEQEYLGLAERMHGSSPDLLRDGGREPLTMTLANAQVYGRKGRIIFADRQVDPQTGTIRMVGEFANPGNVLRPGQYARVRAMTGYDRGALLVPQRAVSEVQGRYQVAVVAPDNKVSIRNAQTGPRVGDKWVIVSGLSPKDRVISQGISKVRDGMTVNPQPDTSGTATQPVSQEQ